KRRFVAAHSDSVQRPLVSERTGTTCGAGEIGVRSLADGRSIRAAGGCRHVHRQTRVVGHTVESPTDHDTVSARIPCSHRTDGEAVVGRPVHVHAVFTPLVIEWTSA